MSPKTAEESDVLEAIGGEIIFTPGDIVYSSSNLIDMAPPELQVDKLLSVMERDELVSTTCARRWTPWPARRCTWWATPSSTA